MRQNHHKIFKDTIISLHFLNIFYIIRINTTIAYRIGFNVFDLFYFHYNLKESRILINIVKNDSQVFLCESKYLVDKKLLIRQVNITFLLV